MKPTIEKHPIRLGGLYRCCTAFYDEAAPDSDQAKEGDTLTCPDCAAGMVLRYGMWQWDGDS